VTDPGQERLGERPAQDPGTTSLSLLTRWFQNDPQAWDRLIYLYYPLVYSWCRRARLQPSDARDVTQEVFQALARSPQRFHHDEGKNSFRGWLWGVARNQLRCFWRKRSKQPQAVGGENSQLAMQRVPGTEATETEPQSQQDDGLVIHRAMELIRTEFEETSWLAFWKVAVEGRPASDVAADLGISRNAVYLAKSRILKRLRVEFADLIVF